MNCTFQTTSKYAADGREMAKSETRDCGQPGALLRIFGQLTSLSMVLCEYHRNHVINVYKWKCEPIKENSNEQQPVSKGERERVGP